MISRNFKKFKFFKYNYKTIINNDSNKFTNFEEFVFNKKNKNANSNAYAFENTNIHINDSDNIKIKNKSSTHSILKSKIINLSKVYQPDLIYLKLEDNFKLIELKKKYLQLAKLYHPDKIASDNSTNLQFNKLQHSYERLKGYHSLREELIKIEEHLNNENYVNLNEEQKRKIDEINEEVFNSMNMERVIDKDNITKDEFIKNLLIEDEFGDIKEPKYMIQFLLSIWLLIGITVFYIDIRKYLIRLNNKREGVNYI